MKIKSIISLFAILVVLVLALTSCDIVNQYFPTPDSHEHTWEEATCTSPKRCTECDATEGEALGHTCQTIPGRAPTCTEPGYTEGQLCSVCDEVIVAQEEIPAAHTEKDVPGRAPTCTETGLTDGKKCGVCGETLVAQEDIPLAAHTEEVVPGRAPTCTETGLTEGKKCSVCGETLVAQEGIPASHVDLDGDYKCDACYAVLCVTHDPSEPVRENETNATCEAGGSYEEVVKCSRCNFEISRTLVQIDPLGHKMNGTVEGTKKTYSCENGCGKTEVKYLVTVNYLYTDGSVAAEADVYEYDDNYMYTVNAVAVDGYVPSHDYVKGHILSAGKVINIYYSEVSVWDGTSISTSLSGSGTAEDPFLVQSGADLAYIAKVVNDAAATTANFNGQYFKMTKSIDLGGNALMIGSYSANKGFHGHFDGNNCVIKGINATQSLFGTLNNGSIKNISLYGKVNTTEKKGVAGLVSYITNSTVENVTNYVDVTGTQQVAGVVGWLENNALSSIKGCVNYGRIQATSYQIGGIAGFAKGTITDCVNFGDVSSSGSGYVGGIGGAAKDAKGSRSGCINYGNVSGTDYVGGCFGQITAVSTDCYSYGSVSCKGASYGDVVGSGATYLTYTKN